MRTHQSRAIGQSNGGAQLLIDLDGDELAQVIAAARAAGKGDNVVGFVFDTLMALPTALPEAGA